MKKFRWLILLVPVTAIVAASCTPAATSTDPQAVAGGLWALLSIVSLLSVFATIAQHGGNGAAACIATVCQFYG